MPPNMLGNEMEQEERLTRKPFEIKMRYKRQTLQDMTRPLKNWLYKHRDNPYPNKAEKVALASDSNMTLTQVSNWFANARRRLKNTVSNPDLSWGKRVKMYNSCVKGNQELLSISSEDSAWESGDEADKTHDMSSPHADSLHARLGGSPAPGASPAHHGGMASFPSPAHAQQQGNIINQGPLSPSLVPLNLSRQAPTPISTPFTSASQDLTPLPIMTSQPQNMYTSSQPSWVSEIEQSPKKETKLLRDFITSNRGHLHTTIANEIEAPPPPQFQFQQLQHQDVRQQQQETAPHTDKYVEESSDHEMEDDPRAVTPCEPDCGNHGKHLVEEQPPKFKSTILQRYIQDSLHHAINPVVNTTRQRNPSGSLSSHDFEDLSVSSRSTPTKEISHEEHNHDYEELWRQWPHISNKASEELHWKEISAALALTALSRGDYRSDASTLPTV